MMPYHCLMQNKKKTIPSISLMIQKNYFRWLQNLLYNCTIKVNTFKNLLCHIANFIQVTTCFLKVKDNHTNGNTCNVHLTNNAGQNSASGFNELYI